MILMMRSNTLAKELGKYPDDFVTVMIDNKEYVIDSIGHTKRCDSSDKSHLCINARDGGDGCLLR